MKIPKEDYLDNGLYPIIDQGQSAIAGYCNNDAGIFSDVPVIAFGDHTCAVKYVDRPFFLGAYGVKLLRCKRDDADVKYLYYALSAVRIPNAGYSRHYKWLKYLSFSLPPVKKQGHIAAVLDRITGLISERNRQLEQLDLMVKSQFIELFGDPVKNPKGWDAPCIEDAVANSRNALKAGPFGYSLKKEFYVESGYKIYGQEQVIRGDAHYGDYYIDEEKFRSLQSCEVLANDVLISLVGTYGKVLIIPEDFEPGIINPRLIKITFNPEKVNTTFFRYFFESDSVVCSLSENTRGLTMDFLNLGIIKKIRLPLPPLPLQNRFAEFARQADKSKLEIRQGLNGLKLQYNALMQKYFG
jgi:type I restriction enzyme S subunit